MDDRASTDIMSLRDALFASQSCVDRIVHRIGFAKLSPRDKISVENGEEEKLNPFRDDTTAM